MKLIVDYNDTDSDTEVTNTTNTTTTTTNNNNPKTTVNRKIQSAPEVHSTSTEITVTSTNDNMTYTDMYKPIQGPVDIFTKPMDNLKNTFTGHVQSLELPTDHFEIQRRTFNNYGYALNPSSFHSSSSVDAYIGDTQKAMKYRGASVLDDLPEDVQIIKAVKKRRLPKGDAAHVDGFAGPWAGYEGEHSSAITRAVSAEEQERLLKEAEEMVRKRTVGAGDTGVEVEETQFHGVEGENYMDVPVDVGVDFDSPASSCSLPRRNLHTYSGHTRGVNMVKFLPRTGHLILSASMDTKIKIWGVYNERNCLRTFSGHEKAVRDISFNKDGTKFLSCSFDKYIKLWDTETGKCIQRYTGERIPYCARFHPENENIMLSPGGDDRILQYDIASKKVTQTYNGHNGPVNTLTFVENGKRFLTTSDDKSLRIWDFNLSVPIKTVTDPSMHSMPAVALYPDCEWLAGQSMDNHITVYGTTEKVRIHKKKRLSGHITAGYACQLAFSPDGKYLVSGDSGGSYYIWDWKTCKVVKKNKAHMQVTIGCDWHPVEASKIVTCSWDGTVKLWE